ncbi:retrovirus-related pol polyprotein from transposon TNT 1-94 [Tanacetum coccineum]
MDGEAITRKIDRVQDSFDSKGFPNTFISLINSNDTAKDLWDALERQIRGSEYGEQDRKAAIFVVIRKIIQNQGDVNDALGYKKKAVMVTLDPLALVVEKTKVSKRREKVVVQSESKESDDEDISDLKKITALLAKAFNRKKYYVKPINNNLRTSSAFSSINKKPDYVKLEEKKEDKKADKKKQYMRKVTCYNWKKEGHFAKDYKKAKVKDYNYYKTKMLLAKKDGDGQVLLTKDQAWMESSSDSDQEISANMVIMAKMEKVLSDSEESSSSAEENIVEIVQIYLWIIDSGCSKYMTGNRALLTNFVKKILGKVRFDGVYLLTGDGSSNLYTISLNDIASNSLACLLAKASSSQSWLWHQRLSHLNFATINNLVKNNLVRGLPKMKFEKDHLCFACEQGKIHQKHHKSKTAFASDKPLYLLHMDLCGPMRVKKEASEVIISFLKKTQVNLQLQVQRVRTDNGTDFKNKTLAKCYLLNDYDDVGKLNAKRDIGVFVGYSKESAAFRIYNKRTRKIYESVNVNFDEISEMASKQFSLEPGLSNLNEMGKSSIQTVSQVSETSKKDLEDLFHNFYDEYFDASKITKSPTTNIETSKDEIPSHEEEVFHESSESFQEESSSS